MTGMSNELLEMVEDIRLTAFDTRADAAIAATPELERLLGEIASKWEEVADGYERLYRRSLN